MNLVTLLDYIERYKEDAHIPFDEAEIFFDHKLNYLIFVEPNREIKYDLGLNQYKQRFLYDEKEDGIKL